MGDITRLAANDSGLQSNVRMFWLRTWMAGETGLAPHCYGQSIKFEWFLKRVEDQLSRHPPYQEFFSAFTPFEDEYLIKESCPDNITIGTACPFPNGFTFLSTNRRIFYRSPSGIGAISLSDIAECELQIEGKMATGMTIKQAEGVSVRLPFKMPMSYAEHFKAQITKRSLAAQDKTDLPKLNAAVNEYRSTGGLKANRKPASPYAVPAGIVFGIAIFVGSMKWVDSFSAALILGALAFLGGYEMATTLFPR